MTKEEAIKAMKAGEKVTHRFFEPNEWITMKGSMIITEEGYSCLEIEFFGFRRSKEWETDWSIWNSA